MKLFRTKPTWSEYEYAVIQAPSSFSRVLFAFLFRSPSYGEGKLFCMRATQKIVLKGTNINMPLRTRKKLTDKLLKLNNLCSTSPSSSLSTFLNIETILFHITLTSTLASSEDAIRIKHQYASAENKVSPLFDRCSITIRSSSPAHQQPLKAFMGDDTPSPRTTGHATRSNGKG